MAKKKKTKDEKLTELGSFIAASDSGYELYSDAFKQLTYVYLMIMNEELKNDLKEREKSNIFFPAVNNRVKRGVADMNATYFSTDEYCSLEADFGADSESVKAVKKLQLAVNYYTANSMDMFESLSPTFYYSWIVGNVPIMVFWGKDAPVIRFKSIDEVKFDPNAETFKDCRYVTVEYRLTKDEIEDLTKAKVFNKSLFNIESLNPSSSNSNIEDDRFGRVNLVDVYVRERDQWTVSTLYDKTIPLRIEAICNDGLPVVFGGMIPQIISPDERQAVKVYYDSPIASLSPLQLEFNIRRNQQIDAVGETVNPSLLALEGSGLDPKKMKSGSGKVLLVKSLNAIREMPVPDLRGLAIDVQQLEKEMDETAGTMDIGMTAIKQNNTATAASIQAGESSSRRESYMTSYRESVMKPLMTKIAMLVWKYGDERFFRGVDRSKNIKFNVAVHAGLGATNKEIQKRGLMEAYAMFKDTQDIENMRRIQKEILPLFGVKNLNEYFPELRGGSEDGDIGGDVQRIGRLGEFARMADLSADDRGEYGSVTEIVQE